MGACIIFRVHRLGYTCCGRDRHEKGCRTGKHTTEYEEVNRSLRNELDEYMMQTTKLRRCEAHEYHALRGMHLGVMYERFACIFHRRLPLLVVSLRSPKSIAMSLLATSWGYVRTQQTAMRWYT